jgi:hypothetical protein
MEQRIDGLIDDDYTDIEMCDLFKRFLYCEVLPN